MTPQEQAVLEAAKRFVEGHGYVQDIAEAVRGLEPPKPELPEEPPNGSVVRLWRGDERAGVAARIDWHDDERGRWYRVGQSASFFWSDLVRLGWRVEVLRPASEVVDADLAQRLLSSVEGYANNYHAGHSGIATLNTCVWTSCVEGRALIAETRAQIGDAS